MSDISEYLRQIEEAEYGEDVRDSIHDAIEQCYSDVSNPTLQTDALEDAIQAKIDAGEMAALTIGDGTITRAKLDPSVTLGMTAIVDEDTETLILSSI